MPRLLFVLGTRPEAIKLCPIVLHIRDRAPEFETTVCVTGQHRGLLDQVLDVFQIQPDHDLNLMRPEQTLSQSTARILSSLESVLGQDAPDMVVVQGDTTTTFAGALAAFYARIPLAHVEAGLRTGDLNQPFPEEANRVLTTRLGTLHFAPTAHARKHLLAEGVPDSAITITGNSGIDAVLYVRDALERGEIPAQQWPQLKTSRKLLLVTAHRRENFGPALDNICSALERLALRPDVQIAFPVHPNPNVKTVVERRLKHLPNVFLLDPLNYVEFVDLMRRAHILITDSGGVQEEGPSLGKPILVLRNKTERPEAVEAGTVRLVGCDPQTIQAEANRLLDDEEEYRRRAYVHNPYGDGHASEKITAALYRYFAGRNRRG